MSVDIKYPDISVRLVGEDGNAFAILGRVTSALKEAGISREECQRYFEEATNGDYENLLAVTMKWVEAY